MNKEQDEPIARGPKPRRLKIEAPWEDSAKQAIRLEKPAAGWPKPSPSPQRAPKVPRKRKAPK